MGLFRRRTVPAPQDLTTRVGEIFTQLGDPATVTGPDEIRTRDGWTISVFNLRERLAALPAAEHEAEIQRYARVMFAANASSGPVALTEVRDQLYPRLVALDALPEGALKDARPFSEELRILPAVDYPDTVRTLTDVAELGGWDTVWPIAMDNLRRLPVPEHQTVGDGAAMVHAFLADDFFGATRVLDLDPLLDRVVGAAREPRHVVVAVPNRQLLLATVIDGPAALDAITTLANVAAGQSERAGGLSANLFYRSPDGSMQQISRRGPQGDTHIEVTDGFAEVMEHLVSMDRD